MQHLFGIVATCVMCLALCTPVCGGQHRPPQQDASADAELEQVLDDLKRAAELDPKDRTVYFFMAQIYSLQYAYRSRRYLALMQAGKEHSDEGERIRSELDQIAEEMERLLERFRMWGVPGNWPEGPWDTPIPRLDESPNRPG